VNVLLLALYFPPDWNGVSIRAYNCAKALTLEGCKVTVISAFPNYPNGHHSLKYKRRLIYSEELDGIQIIRTWVPNFPHFPLSRRIALYLTFTISSLLGFSVINRPDVIFSMNPSLFAFFPSFVYSIFLKKRIIRNVDDLWPEVFYDMGIVKSAFFKKVLDRLTAFTYSVPKMIVPLSSGYVKTLTDKYQIPVEKIKVIQHGVDVQRFKMKPSVENAPNNKFKLAVYSGNISEAYDLELIVDTAALLTKEPIHFVLRGTGHNSRKIEAMIGERGLPNIQIKTDILSTQDLISFLSNADIFLLPMNLTPSAGTADKGLPTKTLEYQAMGRPIVCVSNGEAARYIIETKSGLVSHKRDPNELANLIKRLVADDSLASELGKNGYYNIINNLTLEKIGKQFMEVIYQSLQ
jgi:colanic acid biosynthesis glycosyl transferase WcaI